MTTTVGLYYPVQSFVHRVDARIKILVVLAVTLTLFFLNSFYALFFLALFYLFTFFLSNLPATWVYKALRPVITILLIAFFFQVLFASGEDLLFRVAIGFSVVFRIIILVGFASILAFTTTPIELTDAIEALLFPLKILRLPVSEFAIVMTIALRFIPQILTEAQDLVKAQKARGASFDSANLVKRGKALLPLVIPLFVITYRQALELGKAMEARGYTGGEGRTHYKERFLRNRDYLVLGATFIILTMALMIR